MNTRNTDPNFTIPPAEAIDWITSADAKNPHAFGDGVVLIKLSQNKVAAVDVEDWPRVRGWRWRAYRYGRTLYGRGHTLSPVRSTQRMHRVAIVATAPEVDHRNGNGLDNRSYNLRQCSKSENQRNRGKARHNTSGFKGVDRNVRGKSWRSKINCHGQRICIGHFATAEDAARAYDLKAIELHGEFARTNFPREEYEARTTSLPIQPAEAVACLGQS